MAALGKSFDHVVVGGGVAAAAAVAGIREVDAGATIGVFSAEPDPPYYRPDLSKKLLLDPDATWEGSQLDLLDAEFRADTPVQRLEPDQHRLTCADGTDIAYGRLLLAPGSAPRTTDLVPGPRVIHYRNAADFRALRRVAVPGARIVVVGSGYIGAEITSALTQRGIDVRLVLDVDHVQERLFPPALARRITDDFRRRGVEILRGELVGGKVDGDEVTLRLSDGTELTADAVVVGIGAVPRTQLADAAGIHLDAERGGILVDDQLRTSAHDVWAAGDVASYPDMRLGRRRVEHVDAAETMGRTAGRIMAGADETYLHTPYFWSDLFDDGYEAVGDLDPGLTLVEDWKDDDLSAGVVLHLREGSVRGVLLWNVWDSVPRATELIEETALDPVDDPETLRGRIPLG